MADEDFQLVQEHARQLESDLSERNTMYDNMEDIFLLNGGDVPTGSHIKLTLSPDGRNAVLGGARLISATNPHWRSPFDPNVTNSQAVSDKLERIADAIFNISCRVRRKPIHYEAALSGLLYGETHIAIASTKDIAANNKDDPRASDVQKRTPILFEVLSPRYGYPEFDGLGMSAYFYKVEMTANNVVSRWGDAAIKVLGADYSPYAKVQYCDFYDMTNHVVYVEGTDEPIFMEPHKLPFIPVAVGIIEGSEMFNRENQQTRQPLLYSAWKSGLWQRLNLTLTMMYSMIFAVGANPMFVKKVINPNADEENIDWSRPGNVITMNIGESFEPLVKNAIDPSMSQGLEIARGLMEESTIYRQALGQALGGSAPYSMVSLLNQAGRLPLVPYQRMLSWTIGDAMRMALNIIKIEGGKKKIGGYRGLVEIEKADIPDDFEIQAELDIDMPQDERQNAQMAIQLTQGDYPMVSKAYARQNYLGIGRSSDMETEIWNERASMMQFQSQLQQMVMMQGNQQPNNVNQGDFQAEQRTQTAQPGLPMTEQMPPNVMPGNTSDLGGG